MRMHRVPLFILACPAHPAHEPIATSTNTSLVFYGARHLSDKAEVEHMFGLVDALGA